MDVRRLNALVALADHGSFSGAARALYTVQSNISSHVARLESELGVRLYDRAQGTLTAEGAVVVARARRVQSELEALVGDLDSLDTSATGDVRLGVIGTTARWLVPRLLEALRIDYPRVRAIVVEASTSSLIPRLLHGPLDLAVVNLPVDDPEVATEPLFSEQLICVAPSDHALASYDHVTLAELAEHPLLLSAPGTAVRDDLEAEAARQGVHLRAQAEIDGVRLIASLAFQGFGAAILPATAVPNEPRAGWRRVPVDGLPRRQVGLARRARGLPTAPARALAGLVPMVVALQGADQPGVQVLTSLGASTSPRPP